MKNCDFELPKITETWLLETAWYLWMKWLKLVTLDWLVMCTWRTATNQVPEVPCPSAGWRLNQFLTEDTQVSLTYGAMALFFGKLQRWLSFRIRGFQTRKFSPMWKVVNIQLHPRTAPAFLAAWCWNVGTLTRTPGQPSLIYASELTQPKST